jgi:release factor glutamine methyltransferase
LAHDQRTVGSLLRCLTRDFAHAGLDGPGEDARRLLAAAAGLTPAQLLAHPEQPITAAQADTMERYRLRRLAREPVSRILGWRDFYGRGFLVSPATLDPRPDSETLIATALDIAAHAGQPPLRILDVGTGSGCLLLTLLCELGGATGLGTDISKAALDIARANADRLGLAGRAAWTRADLLDGIEGRFDLVICNPPYIPTGDIPGLDPEVRDFDPPVALDGGPDGLALYRRLLPAISAVVPNGWILLEVGHDQADAVADLLAWVGLPDIAFHKDIAGHRRCVAARTRT